jgi:anti-anti-sigma factor
MNELCKKNLNLDLNIYEGDIMFTIKKKNDSITFELSSELLLVDRAIIEVVTFLEGYNIPDESKFKLVLRELLNNAIEHGNKQMIEKKVSCRITRLPSPSSSQNGQSKRFRIDVLDEGPGFDYNALDFSLPEDPKQIRNRGYLLINAFTDEIRFNETGNKVSVFMSFTNETRFALEEEDGTRVIIPSGNLSAAIADQFREMLLALYKRGAHQFKFDFKHVEDIDSVCLSVLILLYKTLAKENQSYKLEIVNANKDMINLFQLTRLDEIYLIAQLKDNI